MTLKGISAVDARAWASYVRALRAEIAERKAAGELPEDLAAPELMHHLLLEVLDAIDDLRSGRRHSTLRLPTGRALLVFAWYQASVQDWADKRVADGILTTVRSPEADRFWTVVQAAAGVPDRPAARPAARPAMSGERRRSAAS